MNESDLVTALRDRVADVHPDLDRLVAASTRAGTRIRRRRAIGVSLGAAAGVAVIAVGAVQLAGGTDPRPADGSIGIAAEPTPTAGTDPSPAPSAAARPALRLGQTLTTPGGTAVEVQAAPTFELSGEMLTPPEQRSEAKFALVLPNGFTDADLTWLTTTYPGQLVATAAASAGGLVDHAPAKVTASGWTCEWSLADDKADCTSAAGHHAGLVVRAAKDRAVWASSSDKGASADVFVSEAHGDIFITVQSGLGTTSAEIEAIGRSLRWLD